jgi:phospholipid/cholesterol/gamma-HCH transport system substrate-binding protein
VDERLPPILDGLQSLVDTLKGAAESLPRILNSDTEAQLKRVVANSESISDNLLKLSEELRQTRASADRLLNQSQQALGENRDNIRRAVTALRVTLEELSANTETILRNLEGTSHNMNEFSRQIRQNPALLISGKPPRDEAAGNE